MRVANFNAGPAALPQEVLRTAADEMLDWHGTGMSVMEMSHRSPEFRSIVQGAEASVRELMGVPEDYAVLFMQGGGTGQFAAVPMNLMRTGAADYVVSGRWSLKASQEAARYGRVRVAATSQDTGYDRTPDMGSVGVADGSSYLYLCMNETVNGTQADRLPQADVPLVADVSSCLLAYPVDVTRFGLLFGGVQKNVGPAGVTLVVVRRDLIADGPAFAGTPLVFDYRQTEQSGSLYNTPPCWNIYLCGLVFDWLRARGGLERVAADNRRKARAVYDLIDRSGLFRGTARRESRSIMNVTFTTGDQDLDARFVAQAARTGLVGLKGHRSVGGMRASLYNAVSQDDVARLVDFMADFESLAGTGGVVSSSSPSSDSSSI